MHPLHRLDGNCQISFKRDRLNRDGPLCIVVGNMGQTISSTGSTLQKQVSNIADKVGKLSRHACCWACLSGVLLCGEHSSMFALGRLHAKHVQPC